jgi:hypothetical protein
MRTTLEIDDDVLELAKGLASHRKQSIGKVISDLCRKNVQHSGNQSVLNGVRVIQRDKHAVPVTLDLINKLRDENP